MDPISSLPADAFPVAAQRPPRPGSRVGRAGARLVSWYLRSLGDHDTHQGELRGDGTVLARCGAVFTPRPTWRVAGPPPGGLVTGELALRGNPPDPEQVCQECGR